MNNKKFYIEVKPINEINDKKVITEEDVVKVIHLIQNPAKEKYLFINLKTSTWIPFLHKYEFFYKVPEAIIRKSGSKFLPKWYALEYLVRYASEYEDVLLDVVKNTELTFWSYQSSLIIGLSAVSPHKAADMVAVIDEWLNSDQSEMLINPLLDFTNILIKANEVKAAIRILDYIISPVVNTSINAYGNTHRFRIDNYWVNEYIDNMFDKLLSLSPTDMIDTYTKHIMHVINNLKEIPNSDRNEFSYFIRWSIAHNSLDKTDLSVGDQLINGLRDGIQELCEQDLIKGERYIRSQLDSPHEILKRIGLFSLGKYGDQFRSLVTETLFDRRYASFSHFEHEYNGLLHNQFGKLNVQEQTNLIEYLRILSSDKNQNWLYTKLYLISENLPDEDHELFLELKEKYSDQRKQYTEMMEQSDNNSGFVRVDSPIETEELERYSFPNLQHYLMGFQSLEKSFVDKERGLANTVKDMVVRNYEKYSKFSDYLYEPNIPIIYVIHYLYGVQEALQQESIEINGYILRLCEYYCGKEFVSGEVQPDHEWSFLDLHQAIARLLKYTVEKRKTNNLDVDELNLIKSLLMSLCYHPDPNLDFGKNNTNGTGFTLSLNCVRGLAMHGIIYYSFFLAERKSGEENSKYCRELDKDIEKLFKEKLNKKLEVSIAVHSVFGAYFPWLHYYFRNWTEKNLVKIFPEESHLEMYWIAAWNAYLYSSPVYENLFPILISQYQKALIKLLSYKKNVENEVFRPEPNKVMNHIIIAYLYGLTDFDHENKLLDLFYACADDELRGGVGFQIVQALGQKQAEGKNPIWEKAWKLWKTRAFAAESDETNCCYDEELSNLLRLLVCAPLHLDNTELFNVLRISIEKIQGNFVVGILAEFLAKESKEYPKLAIQLLHKLVNKIIDQFYSYALKPDIERTILTNALESTDYDAKVIALKIIDLHAWNGDFQWKDLWDIHYPI